MNRPVILASRSPRRRELLSIIVPSFEVDPPDVDEDGSIDGGMEPAEAARCLALGKALQVAPRHPGGLVIGCDTLVVRDRTCLGKPRDEEEAVEMVLSLAGRDHEVLTGVALVTDSAQPVVAVESTRVTFGPLDAARARAYVARGESLDKAGAYGIQGLGSLLIQGIEGCYFNVVGLPLYRLGVMLEGLGMKLL